LVVGFTVTGAIARGFKARKQVLAERWFARGQRDLAHGDPARAVDEIQTALAFAPDDDAYRLKLALALTKAGKLDEARAHLTNLWEQRPGDATVNLQLARVVARLGDTQEAIRHYHGAIYGVWERDPLQNRETARFELANYLLTMRQIPAAQSELIALAAELPPDSNEQARLGDLMLDAGEPDRALTAYNNASRDDRNNARAELGAARASFALGRYAEALDYVRLAQKINPELKEASLLEQQAQLVLAADPDARGINMKAKAARAQAAYKTASDRLEECLSSRTDSALEALAAQEKANFKRSRPAMLERDPALLDSIVHWVYQVETATEGVCGTPTGVDAALLVLANHARVR
jgi:tetratricopeptide (TPR) repeat protein